MATYVPRRGASTVGGATRELRQDRAAAGTRFTAPTLSGLGERSHLLGPGVGLDTHITDIVNLLFYEDLRDVVLAGHSYGGMVITGVADRAADRVGAPRLPRRPPSA